MKPQPGFDSDYAPHKALEEPTDDVPFRKERNLNLLSRKQIFPNFGLELIDSTLDSNLNLNYEDGLLLY